MPIDLSWVIPSRVVRIHAYGDISIDRLRALSKQKTEYIEAGVAPVHFLLDDKDATPPPINVRVLVNAYGFKETASVGWVIGVGKPHAIGKIVVPLFMKALRMKFLRVDSTDEAIAFLKKQDVTLQSP